MADWAHPVKLTIPVRVVADVEDVFSAVEFLVNHVGVLDERHEGHIPVGNVHPVLVGKRPVHDQD